MSAASPATEPTNNEHYGGDDVTARGSGVEEDSREDQVSDDAEDEEEEEDEPKLKYAKLTGSLGNVYRNGDSTSAFYVAGDKMVVGTHNGNIHALSVPEMRIWRTYHAHSASITAVSVSPIPAPPSLVKNTEGSGYGLLEMLERTTGVARKAVQPQTQGSPKSPRQQQSPVPNTPNNQLYIATSSLDGHVCVSSLIDPKDVQLRNFKRPVSAVALSPQYRSDKTYLSGGLAGQLILTIGGAVGRTIESNVNSAAAAATGWLGSIGMVKDTGQDTVLHQGEGKISEIRWSRSQKWVCWVNEEGIKIMRSHLKLGEQSEDAWRRIAHASKPNRKGWVDMAGVWRARVEWTNDHELESDDVVQSDAAPVSTNGANVNGTMKSKSGAKIRKVERLIVGWGDTAWVLHVQEGNPSDTGQKRVGSADIIHKLQFRDCVVCGISLFTPSMLAILAYRTRDNDDQPIQNAASSETTKKGRLQRHTGLAPQLRLIEVASGEEADLDELSISRFETLSAQDYHFGTVYIPPPKLTKAESEQKSNLEAMWELSGGAYATKLFSSSASVLSKDSGGREEAGKASSSTGVGKDGSMKGVTPTEPRRRVQLDAHPYAAEPGLKLFIQSPYDCILAIKRDLSDRLDWMVEHQKYAEAWTLIDEHPDVVSISSNDQQSVDSSVAPSTPTRADKQGTLADFFDDDSHDLGTNVTVARAQYTAAQREKRRIGELWLQQLTNASRWKEAGEITAKVLGNSSRWEHWVWAFAQAGKFDEITPFIPSSGTVLPSLVYEVILGHYIVADRTRLTELLEQWDPELFDVSSVVSAIESQLDGGVVSEDTIEQGERGRDWKILTEALAKLYLAKGRARDALRCYIRTQNADAAMSLIRDDKMVGAVAEDIPGLLMLKVSRDLMKNGSLQELEDASSEAVNLLAEEAHRGTVSPHTVVQQLESRGPAFQPFLFFYFRTLWYNTSSDQPSKTPRRKWDRRIDEGHALVEDHADLAVSLFAEYDRSLLMTFLRASTIYSYDKATAICEHRHYIPELVYVLSKTGQTKRALYLIIGELGDVKQAIEFCKENPDLWNEMLDYSMDKPSFIRGLLEEVGTAIDPVQLVRRIPEGLEINGLRDGLAKMMREHEIQWSISEGVSKVLRGEVAMGIDTLRAGQKKGVKFEVVHESIDEVDIVVKDTPLQTTDASDEILKTAQRKAQTVEAKQARPGHCVACGEAFREDGKETLIGFACGHVYHLSCLLRAHPDTANDRTIDRLLSQLGTSGEHEDYSGRSVGGKVAHAHVIKNVLRGGCQYCVVPQGA